MSAFFTERVIEEHGVPGPSQQASNDEVAMPSRGLDFSAYLDFELAWENRSTPAGVRYFFPVLDHGCRGFITQARRPTPTSTLIISSMIVSCP